MISVTVAEGFWGGPTHDDETVMNGAPNAQAFEGGGGLATRPTDLITTIQ
jgi:hypothetical protein